MVKGSKVLLYGMEYTLLGHLPHFRSMICGLLKWQHAEASLGGSTRWGQRLPRKSSCCLQAKVKFHFKSSFVFLIWLHLTYPLSCIVTWYLSRGWLCSSPSSPMGCSALPTLNPWFLSHPSPDPQPQVSTFHISISQSVSSLQSASQRSSFPWTLKWGSPFSVPQSSFHKEMSHAKITGWWVVSPKSLRPSRAGCGFYLV